MSDILFLFCGGLFFDGKSYRPKPLMLINGQDTLLEKYLLRLPSNKWDKILLLVENDFTHEFRELIKKMNFPFEISLLECKNGSSTFEKFKVSILNSEFDIGTYSYPDIFVENEYWEDAVCDDMTITKVVSKSRFPKISEDIFSNVVRGVTLHSSNVPANPHYIYGGKFVGSRKKIEEYLTKYLDCSNIDAMFEVDFLNFLAKNKVLTSSIYYGNWHLFDNNRDLNGLI